MSPGEGRLGSLGRYLEGVLGVWPGKSWEAAGAAETPTAAGPSQRRHWAGPGCRARGALVPGPAPATYKLSAVCQRCPLPKRGLSPVLPFSVMVTSRACSHCPPSSPVPAWEAGSRWPAVLTQFPVSQCGAASPTLVQGEPRGRDGRLSTPSTPGKQHPPHPHSEVCRGGGNWVAISCACGPGELATWSSGAVTVVGRASHLPQGQ